MPSASVIAELWPRLEPFEERRASILGTGAGRRFSELEPGVDSRKWSRPTPCLAVSERFRSGLDSFTASRGAPRPIFRPKGAPGGRGGGGGGVVNYRLIKESADSLILEWIENC